MKRQTALLQNEQKPTGQQQDAGVINAGFDVKEEAQLPTNFASAINDVWPTTSVGAIWIWFIKKFRSPENQFRLQAEKERLQKGIRIERASIKNCQMLKYKQFKTQ